MRLRVLLPVVGILGEAALELEVYEVAPYLPGDQQELKASQKSLPTFYRVFMEPYLGAIVQQLLDIGFYLLYLF